MVEAYKRKPKVQVQRKRRDYGIAVDQKETKPQQGFAADAGASLAITTYHDHSVARKF